MTISDLAGTVLEHLACIHVTLMIPIACCSCLFVFIALFFTSYWYISLLYAVWWFYDRDTPYLAGRYSSFMRNMFYFKYVARYFPIKLHKTADLDPSKNYIFVFHPHGFFVFGGIINFATNGTGFDEIFPGLTLHFLTLNGQFDFPFYRDYLISVGFGSANAESIDFKLTQLGPGHSVFIAVGGTAENLLIEPNRYALKLKDRKGFIRRALKTGACVVPVFSFNEDHIYNMSIPMKGTVAYYLQQLVKFIFRIEVPIDVHGRPYCWYLLPFRRPINTVVGKPLDFCALKSFKKGQDPPEELVDECHAIFLDEIRNLYDENKARFGDENTPLVFV